MQYTSAGKAGFITGMYIVIVPILGLFMGVHTRLLTWMGIALAVLGLYQLSVVTGKDGLHINRGDVMQLIGAVFWAMHVVTLGTLARRVPDLVGLSAWQFVVAALWSALLMFGLETPQWQGFREEWLPLLYAGVVASGVAFTLQVIGQRGVANEVAALILALEAVFALLMGMLFLGEQLDGQQWLGCGLMLAGIMLTLWPEKPQALAV
ncbi:MAG: DMT family transporter [Thiolinea sp.]